MEAACPPGQRQTSGGMSVFLSRRQTRPEQERKGKKQTDLGMRFFRRIPIPESLFDQITGPRSLCFGEAFRQIVIRVVSFLLHFAKDLSDTEDAMSIWNAV